MGAVLLLLVGWLLAKILRALTGRVLALFDSGLHRLFGARFAERMRLARSGADVLGAIVFWAVLLAFVTAATNMMGLETFTQWLARLLDQLPTVLAGVLIVVVGYILSRAISESAAQAAASLETSATSSRVRPRRRSWWRRSWSAPTRSAFG